jgi:hypothetical protein
MLIYCSGWRVVTAERKEKNNLQEDVEITAPGKKERLGYWGRTALRKEQCNGYDQRVAGQQLRKHE